MSNTYLPVDISIVYIEVDSNLSTISFYEYIVPSWKTNIGTLRGDEGDDGIMLPSDIFLNGRGPMADESWTAKKM